MANYSLPMPSQMTQDSEIWNNLKQAIAASSGFQRWQVEHISDDHRQQLSLDYQVGRYLRETLETLAY